MAVQAMRTILTGRPITGEEALSWGLVCDLMEDCDMLQQTIATAKALTEHGSEALHLAKEAVCKGNDRRESCRFCAAHCSIGFFKLNL